MHYAGLSYLGLVRIPDQSHELKFQVFHCDHAESRHQILSQNHGANEVFASLGEFKSVGGGGGGEGVVEVMGRWW